MGTLEIFLSVIILFLLINFVILIFISIFLVRLRDIITQLNSDDFFNLSNNIDRLLQKNGIESWDKKYETELEKLNERLRSGSNLDDL